MDNTQVVTKEQKSNLPAMPNQAWGSEGAHTQDMIISRFMLQQALSDGVAKGKATPGDIIESVGGEMVAKKGESAEIIPITTFKTWMRYQFLNNKWEFLEQVPFSIENAGWQYECEIDGIKHRNDAVLNFFVLLANKLSELPFLLSFKRSSYYTGKKLSTHFSTSAMKNLPPASSVFKLSSVLTTSDKNSYWVFALDKSRASKEEELKAAYNWYLTLSNKGAKIDETDDSTPF